MSSSSSVFVVAIDGPSGVGKSTVSRRTAMSLRLRYLDTGAMYRALTWQLMRDGVDVNDPDAVAGHLDGVVIESGTEPRRPAIRVNGVDASGAIRTAEVTAQVSAVSAVPAARAKLLVLQREIIGSGGIVVEGRDIGSVVAPDADLKVYLTAVESVRAQRRSSQLSNADHVLIQRDLARRDAYDSSRAASPLSVADDAVVIDTTQMDLPEVVATVVELAVERGAARTAVV